MYLPTFVNMLKESKKIKLLFAFTAFKNSLKFFMALRTEREEATNRLK